MLHIRFASGLNLYRTYRNVSLHSLSVRDGLKDRSALMTTASGTGLPRPARSKCGETATPCTSTATLKGSGDVERSRHRPDRS